jgi:hypothetical protein
VLKDMGGQRRHFASDIIGQAEVAHNAMQCGRAAETVGDDLREKAVILIALARFLLRGSGRSGRVAFLIHSTRSPPGWKSKAQAKPTFNGRCQ